jgi:glycerol-3-phosphate O-acyltransferase
VTLDDAITLVEPLLAYVRKRQLPGTDDAAQVATRAGMRRVLAELEAADVVEAFTDGADAVYRITPERELAAAFFRNGVIHWFVNRAIVELALVAAAEVMPQRSDGDLPDLVSTGLEAAFALRDLLKFEFFFTEKAEFEEELFAELEMLSPHWQRDRTVFETLGSSTAVWGGLVADRVLRSFLEAYWVVADRLVDHGANMVDEKDLVDSCLKVGCQYLLQRRIVSDEAVSAELFRNALRLAGNRGLLDPDNPSRAEGRRALAAEVQAALRRLEQLNRWQQAHRIRRVGDQRVDASSDGNAVDISTDGDAVDLSQHADPERSDHDPGRPAATG